MLDYHQALLTISSAYNREGANRRGGSLARVATVVVNRGSFFDRLYAGHTCSLRNYQKLVAHFFHPANWPAGGIPQDARAALQSIGIMSGEA